MQRAPINCIYRVLLVALLAAATVGGYLLYASLRRTKVVLDLPYNQAESRLFSALNLTQQRPADYRQTGSVGRERGTTEIVDDGDPHPRLDRLHPR